MKLHFSEYGSGKPIVLLHAFPLSSRMWETQVEFLAQRGWRVILPDHPGFGHSMISADTTTIDAVAQSVAELLEDLNIEQSIVGGLSMGGYVALSFYRNFPEKVSALVLADTTAKNDSPQRRESRFQLIEKIEKFGSEVLIDEMLPKMISEHTKKSNAPLVEDIVNAMKEADEKGVSAALRGMAKREDFSGFLPSIKVPTLLIFGENDRITDIKEADFLHTKIEKSILSFVPDAGHLSNLENPEVFNESLLEFLMLLGE